MTEKRFVPGDAVRVVCDSPYRGLVGRVVPGATLDSYRTLRVQIGHSVLAFAPGEIEPSGPGKGGAA